MKTVMNIALCLIAMIGIAWAGESTNGATDRSYREVWEHYAGERAGITKAIDVYKQTIPKIEDIESKRAVFRQECLEKRNTFDLQMRLAEAQGTDTSQKRLSYKFASEREMLEGNIKLLKEELEEVKKATTAFNELHGEGRQEVSLKEIKEDLGQSRRRVKEIDDKLTDLKLTVLKMHKKLPAWWKE